MGSKCLRIKREGRIINGWKVLKYIGKTPAGNSMYTAKCPKCKKSAKIRGSRIASQAKCGACQKVSRINPNNAKDIKRCQNQSIDILYKKYKESAKSRNYEFNLSRTSFIKIISRNCYYCGVEPRIYNPKKNSKYSYKPTAHCYDVRANGIDRKNNKTGYNTKNCVSCCKICNTAKMALDDKEFKQWIRRAYEHQNRATNRKK